MLCFTDKKKGVIRYIKLDVQTTSDHDHLYSEARILLRMPHPNIIRIRDVFKSKGEIGTTYEKIEGKTIKERLSDGVKIGEKECIKIFVQMMLAFQMIHENKVMHKNVRPEHFLLDDATGLLKTIGFSKLREMIREESLGSIAPEDKATDKEYSPPECVDGRSYTRSADLWVCGLILFQMASGGVFPYDQRAD